MLAHARPGRYEDLKAARAARRARIAALVAAHTAGDKNAYVTCATALAAEFGQDPAIMFLIDRLNTTENGESYVLS